jgi:hypothetical protein
MNTVYVELLALVREELEHYELLSLTNRSMLSSEKNWMDRAKKAISRAENEKEI